MSKHGKESKEYYKLFIDESGTANPLDKNSEIYILCGCSVKKSDCNDIKILADQIKFKYWGKTDVVFHSNEIGRKEGDFIIFKDKTLFGNFLKDLEDFLSSKKFKMFFIIVNKCKARSTGWNDIKIYKDTTLFLIRHFLLILLTLDSRGEIIIESSSAEKDIYMLKALNYFLGSGIDKLKIDYKTVQETLTSVSFVTKQNNDIEEQIADLFGYAAKLKYMKQLKETIPNGLYEEMLLRVIGKNIFKIPKEAGFQKSKLFKEVEPFLILP